MRVEPHVREMDVREPETHAQGNDSAAMTPSQPRAFFPAPDLVATALEASKIGVWSGETAANRVPGSANLEAINHTPAGRFDGTFAGFEDAIPPEDRAAVVAAVKESLRSHKPYRTLSRLPPQP